MDNYSFSFWVLSASMTNYLNGHRHFFCPNSVDLNKVQEKNSCGVTVWQPSFCYDFYLAWCPFWTRFLLLLLLFVCFLGHRPQIYTVQAFANCQKSLNSPFQTKFVHDFPSWTVEDADDSILPFPCDVDASPALHVSVSLSAQLMSVDRCTHFAAWLLRPITDEKMSNVCFCSFIYLYFL